MSDGANYMSFKDRLNRIIDEKHFAYWGIMGAVIGFVFILSATIGYVGRSGEPYSMLNHFISELGELGVSHLAWLFNLGLILAGFVFLPFLIGLGLYIENKIAKIALVFGIISAIAIILVGFFPMNYLLPHYLAAMTFFFGGMITVAVFTIAIFFQEDAKIPKTFIIPGLITIFTFIYFLFFIDVGDLSTIFTSRPDILLIAIFEWVVYFAIIGYMLLVAVYVFLKERK